MNEKNGDVNVSAAKPPFDSLAEWLAQVKMSSGLSARITLCFAFGEPSTVDLRDALATLDVLRPMIQNLLTEAERRAAAVALDGSTRERR